MERSDWSTSKMGKWEFNRLDLVELEGEQYSCCKSPWPPKYYTCAFCKREFRSAQALGGHMNVHRKDRARLRLFSSWVLESQNPNKPNSNPNHPNPNPINSSSPSDDFSVYPHHSLLSPLFPTPSSSVLTYGENPKKSLNPQLGDLSQENTMTSFPAGVENLKVNAPNYKLEVGGVTGLDLVTGFGDTKEVLDLDLRLGHL
ncbi:hypothetical protein Goarm_019236 [Gossypium armourianum]|uniref:C2H2-type domain-containing protein n=1 Tax=Gossypium armourianum TaxID=34283 RepID=A0A7J9IKR6_9ROSI|nr:hypothetical protein [Gossypium armourianum]